MNPSDDPLSIQKNNSKAFLRELLMDNLLRSAPDADKNEDLRLPAGIALPSRFPVPDEPVSAGQVRLLPQIGFPTYVAVLGPWAESSFLIAPFSRFSKPATEEELETTRNGGAFMNVLQIWNARTATVATLRKSWIAGTLPEQDVKDALLLWKWSIGDVADLPERISERTGVPIYRTDDPRLEYRRESLETFAAFDAEDDTSAERVATKDSAGSGDSGVDGIPIDEWTAIDFSSINFLKSLQKCAAGALPGWTPKNFWTGMEKFGIVHRVAEEVPCAAAAAPVSSNPRRTFLVEGVPAKLRVEYSRSEKCLVFSVWDGKRRVKSAALDGFSLVVESRTDSIPIRDKSARIPAPAPSVRFVLLDPAGKVVELKEEGL